MKTLRIFVIALAATLTLRAETPKAEAAKIEVLLKDVAALDGAKFIRNGSEYDASSAVKFLRGKWSHNEDEIKTAEDFIAKAASVSGTSGKPYMIRMKDGREVKCADFLREKLAAQK